MQSVDISIVEFVITEGRANTRSCIIQGMLWKSELCNAAQRSRSIRVFSFTLIYHFMVHLENLIPLRVSQVC